MNDKEKNLLRTTKQATPLLAVLPDSDMVHKVTIIPRGGTGGVTVYPTRR